MSRINIIENRKKVNSIYNQCVIYTLMLGALSVPFLTSSVTKQPKKPTTSNRITIHMPAAVAQLLAKPIVAQAQISNLATDKTEIQLANSMDLTHGAGNAEIPNNSAVAHAAVDAETQAANDVAFAHASIQNENKTAAMTLSQTLSHFLPKFIVPVESKSLFAVETTSKNNAQITIQSTKIDRNFLQRMEGSILRGYVPLPKTTKSGVTIASGFDIGQLNLQAFNQLPISDALKAKLRPYVGLKKYAAVEYLKAHPLTITKSEMNELDNIAANMILQPLVKSYDKASKTPFVDLPAQAQTALFSFAYQYGSGFMYKSGTRQLWKDYVAQNWAKVSNTLHSFRSYAPRRQQEAKLIKTLAMNNQGAHT